MEIEQGSVRRLDVLDVLLIFARRKWLIAAWALAGVVVALIVLFRSTTLYKSAAVIMPPQQEQSSAALLSQLGALTAFAGVGSGIGQESGRFVRGDSADQPGCRNMVDRFHLMDAYEHSRPGWRPRACCGSGLNSPPAKTD